MAASGFALLAATGNPTQARKHRGHVSRSKLTENDPNSEQIDKNNTKCHIVSMSAPEISTDNTMATRRATILLAARWCFLNFGYAKTSLDDIARRAGVSRTLIYRVFKDKEDIFSGVFDDWLACRHPVAERIIAGPGSRTSRLLKACEVLVLQPWCEMVTAPMACEFHQMGKRLIPNIEAKHRAVLRNIVQAVLNDREATEVFVLALHGFQSDVPDSATMQARVALLIDRFVSTPEGNHDRPDQ